MKKKPTDTDKFTWSADQIEFVTPKDEPKPGEEPVMPFEEIIKRIVRVKPTTKKKLVKKKRSNND